MKVKLLSEGAKIPTRADEGAAGLDLYTPKNVIIKNGRNIVPLDIAIALHPGYEAHIRPRSGFSAKGMEGHKLIRGGYEKEAIRLNADVIQGTIDQTYRGNVGVIIKSEEAEPFLIPAGTRIAQMVIEQCYMGDFELVQELDETERGEGGFGHTGTK